MPSPLRVCLQGSVLGLFASGRSGATVGVTIAFAVGHKTATPGADVGGAVRQLQADRVGQPPQRLGVRLLRYLKVEQDLNARRQTTARDQAI